MAKVSDAEMLADIRRRFVGTGEEHDLLSRLTESYRSAYERGAGDRQLELQQQSDLDRESMKFARTLCDLNWPIRSFVNMSAIDDYNRDEIVGWLKQCGKTPAMLRELADAMEKAT